MDVGSEISRFVKVNKLEERCEKILRDLDAKLAFQVGGGVEEGKGTKQHPLGSEGSKERGIIIVSPILLFRRPLLLLKDETMHLGQRMSRYDPPCICKGFWVRQVPLIHQQ